MSDARAPDAVNDRGQTPPVEVAAHPSSRADSSPAMGSGRTPVADSHRSRAAFSALKWISLFHSCVYLGLLVCAFALHKPEPATFALGLGHGLLWIFMSIACIVAARLRIVPLRLAVAVAVLGGIGPFFGSGEFLREQRRRSREMTPR